jgi:peptidoglycan/LPS O-acetylase OafA/YrhL
MTPEQAARQKSWMLALIGGGLACLYTAYQYAKPWVPGTEPAPDYAPYLFGGIAIACFVAAALLWSRLKKDPTSAAVTDLSAPGGKTVKILLVIGFAGMAGTWLIGYITPEGEPLGLSLSIASLLIAIVCFVSAGRLAKKMRRAE